ncbi:hypothetical protein ABFS82_07G055900 [Erythranthe guttata]
MKLFAQLFSLSLSPLFLSNSRSKQKVWARRQYFILISFTTIQSARPTICNLALGNGSSKHMYTA